MTEESTTPDLVELVHGAFGRPLGTAGYVTQREGWVFTWAEGLIVNHTIYHDIDEGRAAAQRLAEARG
jgi:hypothetical protein